MEVKPSNYLLDSYVSFDLSSLLVNNAVPYDIEINWVSAFILNSTLRYRYEEKQRIFMMNLLRRLESTFQQYNSGSILLSDYLQNDRKRISTYLNAVTCFEISISHLYQSYLLGNRMIEGHKLFNSNDGSSLDRLNKLYNESKHYDGSISAGSIGELNTIPIWITNEGLKSKKVFLDFSELQELMNEMKIIANEIIK